MFFTTQDGERFKMSAVIMVDSLDPTGCYYNVHLSGGQHVTIKESFKTRASFVQDWETI